MDIKELQQERENAEEEIEKTIQSVLENFTKKTGLYIHDITVNLDYQPTEIDGHEMYGVEKVILKIRL